jgi:uncharacterized protein (DUF433 family)
MAGAQQARVEGGGGTLTARPLTPERQYPILHAFRLPTGYYTTERAAQLAGVPARTLDAWARDGTIVPDHAGHPVGWSYRDLMFVRLLAWLRQGGMERTTAARRVSEVRKLMVDAARQVGEIRSDGNVVLLGDEAIDRLTGQQVFDAMAPFLSPFSLLNPIAELGRRRRWGPDLVYPSEETWIVPWAVCGAPCVRFTRISTIGLHVLRHEHGLDAERIVALYPDLNTAQVEDAIALEERLCRAT